jgi:hypothetical protein
MILLLLPALLIAPAGSASAKVVINESGTVTELFADWYDDDSDDTFSYGYAAAYTMNRRTFIDYYSYTETPLGDGCYEVTYTEAWGPGTLTVAKKYETGLATGTLDGWTGSYVWCEGDGENGEFEADNGGSEEIHIDITLAFTATSSLIRETSSSSFKIPGEVNENSRFTSQYRRGATDVTVDGDTIRYSQLGTFTYRYHTNGK